MRLFIFLFLILPLTISAQRFALIDKKLKSPILYTDSVTVEQVKSGYFPIENKSVDTLIGNIIYLKNVLGVRQRSKMESFELKSSNVIIKTNRVPFAYGDRYNSVMESKNQEVVAKFTLIDSELKNKNSSKFLSKLLRYFESNKSFYTYPYEVTPKMYNVVVIIE